MLSFEVAGGAEAARRFCEAVEVFTLAESLGGVESLVAHPATMTHASIGPRDQAGRRDHRRTAAAVRRLESEADLVADLQNGLSAAGVQR